MPLAYVRIIVITVFPHISIGGEETLETVTTLASKSPSAPFDVVQIGATRWQSWTVLKLGFYFLCSHFPVFFFFMTDILKKFNPNIKGMSMGNGTKQAGFNVAVSGAKASWVPSCQIWIVYAHAFYTSVHSCKSIICHPGASLGRFDVWLMPLKVTL